MAAVNLRRRLIVFGIPFLACAVTIQPIQYALRVSREDPGRLFARVESTGFWQSYLSTGAFVSHLWFLINLIVYYCFVYLLIRILKSRDQHRRRLGRWWSAIPTRVLASKATIALLSAVTILPAYSLLSRLPQVPGYGLEDLALYSPFFLAGYVCFVDERAMSALGRVGLLDLVLLVAGVMVLLSGSVTNRVAAEIFGFWLFYQAAWTLGMLMVTAFRKWLNVDNAAMRAVSDASYTIYLFHHLIVIVIATAVLPIPVPGAPWTKYLLVVFATFLLALVLHRRVIRRYKWLSFAFNGR